MTSLSPSVEVREKDRTLGINNLVSNGTGYVGMFRWGPAEEVTRITTNEAELVQRFGRPDSATSLYFHAALNYLLYTNPLYVIRTVGTGALNSVPTGETPLLVKNDADYENATLTGISFIGRYAGSLGNNLLVSVADDSAFDTWEYADEFDYAPSAGEFNLIVVDEDGFITGNAGTVLERYSLLSKTPGAKRPDGTPAYVTRVLEDQSNWILAGDLTAIDFAQSSSLGIYEVSLQGGADDNDSANADFNTAWNIFSNSEVYDIVRVFTSSSPAADASVAVDVMDTRQDAVAFLAPMLADVYNNATATDDVKDYFNTDINKNSSYAFYVDNWKLIYDKYNDTNIWIPTDSDAAALHARTFVQNEPWFSPAGLNRGQLKNVIKLAWSPNKAQRDVLYKNSINSIVAFPGEGTVLFGDKTALRRPSAFSRINVRTLFIVLKKNISNSARYQLFELNDFITRGVFRNAVDQYLSNVQARRGLYDYRVVADETNNTSAVIDANEFVGDIYLKPARSINFIKLNFIAVASNVQFEEVEG